MKQPLKIHEAFYAKWSQTNGLTRNQLPSVACAYIDVSNESLDICIRITDILLLLDLVEICHNQKVFPLANYSIYPDQQASELIS